MTVSSQTCGPWHFAIGTDVGRQRDHNEDSISVRANTAGTELLLSVFDGMGGHAAGDVASRGAAEIVRHAFDNSAGRDPREVLFFALVEANDRIVQQGQANPDQAGMGSTAVVAWLRGQEVWVGHVGDSRMYHLRDGGTLSRTTDHTKVGKMVAMGIITPEEAAHHPDANVVLRALGHMPPGGQDSEKRPEVTNSALRFRRGDAMVLCSDGLYDLLSDQEIAQALVGRSPGDAVSALIHQANERGGHDNISVAVAIYEMPVVPWTVARQPQPRTARKTQLDIPRAPAAGRAPVKGRPPTAFPKPERPQLPGWLSGIIGAAIATAVASVAFVLWSRSADTDATVDAATQADPPVAAADRFRQQPAATQPATGTDVTAARESLAIRPRAGGAAAELPPPPVADPRTSPTTRPRPGGDTLTLESVEKRLQKVRSDLDKAPKDRIVRGDVNRERKALIEEEEKLMKGAREIRRKKLPDTEIRSLEGKALALERRAHALIDRIKKERAPPGAVVDGDDTATPRNKPPKALPPTGAQTNSSPRPTVTSSSAGTTASAATDAPARPTPPPPAPRGSPPAKTPATSTAPGTSTTTAP